MRTTGRNVIHSTFHQQHVSYSLNTIHFFFFFINLHLLDCILLTCKQEVASYIRMSRNYEADTDESGIDRIKISGRMESRWQPLDRLAHALSDTQMVDSCAHTEQLPPEASGLIARPGALVFTSSSQEMSAHNHEDSPWQVERTVTRSVYEGFRSDVESAPMSRNSSCSREGGQNFEGAQVSAGEREKTGCSPANDMQKRPWL